MSQSSYVVCCAENLRAFVVPLSNQFTVLGIGSCSSEIQVAAARDTSVSFLDRPGRGALPQIPLSFASRSGLLVRMRYIDH